MLESFKHSLALMLTIPLVTVLGLVFSIRFGFLQVTHLKSAWQIFIKDRDPNGKSTSFSAISAVIGGNLGTGNIAGIAVALSTGGPGSLFWMWIIAFLGAILKFIGCTLSILYRKQDEAGEYVGGPMYYLLHGLNLKFAAKLFCVLTILAALTVGNIVQMNSLALPLTQAGVNPLVTGGVMSIIVATVILGGLHRFSYVVSKVVPVMAIAYVVACLIVITRYNSQILPALQQIIHAAFHPTALAGGIMGYGVLEGLRVGFDRGLFATDVGVGIAPIIHSSVESNTSREQTALTQGLISTLSPLIVMIVCTLTGLVLMVTDAWLIRDLESTNICIEAFKRGLALEWAGQLVTVTLFFFAFTTILTWSFCADKAIEFLWSRDKIKYFQYLFVLVIPVGTLVQVKTVWPLADIFMNLMLIINLVALVGLYPKVTKLFKTTDIWNKVLLKN